MVAGGWTERQFMEDRRPTQSRDRRRRAGSSRLYPAALQPRAARPRRLLRRWASRRNPDLAARVTVERDKAGQPTGWLTGDNRAISDLFDLLPRPTYAQKVEGTRAFFRALNAVGVTGVIDPGGYNLSIPDYQPLFEVWRERGLTLRVRYSLSAPRRGRELEDFKELTQMLPMGFGDDWLRFNGIGENVTWGLYNNDTPTEAQKEQLVEVLRWAVSRGMTATFHWHNDRAVHHLLDVLERVNAETPVAGLRWSIAHLNDASPESLKRMKAMGLGWLMQNAFYFRGEAFLGQRGARTGARLAADRDRAEDGHPGRRRHRRAPGDVVQPVRLAAMDARRQDRRRHRHARRRRNCRRRIEALRLYTQGSAWFTFDENARGSLAVGQARRPRGAEQGLPHRADRRDRRHRLAAHHGRRPHRLCRRAVRGV